jgi:MHS family proline/betaine transporter-like MFS transporter
MNNQPTKHIIIPGSLGNLLESYDFALYGYFSPLIAQLFFPSHDPFLSLLATFAIFAVGLFFRPVGAIVFSYFADKAGRKKALLVSVILMAVSTTAMGLLPTYAQIGISAAVLLTVCRMLQGLSMGGEFTGSLVYMTEHAPVGKRGLYGGWAMCGTFMGLLVGSGVSALLNQLLSAEAMLAWGWRLPFLAGILLGFAGLYLRLRMPETPNFTLAKAEKRLVKNPLFTAIKEAPLSMLLVMGLNFLPAMGFYLLFVYLSSWMKLYLQIPLSVALTINTVSLLMMVILLPLIGFLSDKIGRKPTMLAGILGFILFSYPLFLLLQQADFITMLLAHACFALLTCFVFAPLPATLIELLPTHIRCSGVSVPFNIGNALFGGTGPFVATYLIHATGKPVAPSFYLMLAGVVMFLIVIRLKESHQRPLS